MTTRLRTLLLLAACAAIGACRSDGVPADDTHGAGHAHGPEEAGGDAVHTGPNGGRLLERDGYAVELRIVEDKTPPRFRAWLTRSGEALPAQRGRVEVVLERLGGAQETHALVADGDALQGPNIVGEPHSFDVAVKATIDDKSFAWDYDSYEGRTTIPAAIATEAGILTAPARAGEIRDEHDVQGLITPVEGRHARVVARFPGPVRRVEAGVGDDVRAGQTLAVVESNISLSNYAVTAPFAGTVLARNAAPGDLAGDTALFEIADLSSVWVDLHLFGADAQHITPGLPVAVERLSDGVRATTRLDRVLPGTATASQSTVARATIANGDRRWRTGAAVRARVTVSVEPVALLVPLAALQRLRDWDVVFIRVGETYEVRPLELGRRDGVNVEVLSGIAEGDEVVVGQSYLIKADIEKSGASHDH
jgi:cobalt-zinc-cadmium efflux system membrane fusion protein